MEHVLGLRVEAQEIEMREIAYVAFVVVFGGAVYFGGQALLEARSAVAETKALTPQPQKAKVVARDDFKPKKELSPLFPVIPNKELLNKPPQSVEIKSVQPKVVVVAQRVKGVAKLRRPTQVASNSPQAAYGYAEERRQPQTDIFSFLFR